MEEVRTLYTDVLFDVRLSIRYHERRQGFFGGLLNATLFASLTLNSAAAGILLSRTPEIWATVAMLIVATMSAACLAYGARDKAARHDDLRRRFITLESEIRRRDHTDEVAEWGELERLAIEADEPPTLSTIYALCHNEESKAMDFAQDDLIPITKTQRFLAHFIDWKEDSLRLPESA